MKTFKKSVLMLLIIGTCFAISPAMTNMAATKKTTQMVSSKVSTKKKASKKKKTTAKAKKKNKAKDKTTTRAKKTDAVYKDLANGFYSIKKLAKDADTAVLKAFDTLGLLCKIDNSCPASGSLNMGTGVLTIKKYNKTLYIKLGTFLYEITDMGSSSEAEKIYESEYDKASFLPVNVGYKNKKEAIRNYYSMCYWQYTVARKQFCKECPKTAAFFNKTVANLAGLDMKSLKKKYVF